MEKTAKVIKGSVIRFAGDSGDGMQLTGSQFTQSTAELGLDLSTLPDYPAEIRAPAGTLFGVSGFQIQFSSEDIHSPGDEPDVLVAMNPAALKVNLKDLKKGGIIIANTDSFIKKNLDLAHYSTNPLEDGTLDGYTVFEIPITKSTTLALQDSGLNMKEITRCKNFYALGIMFWLYNRPLESTIEWIKSKFSKSPLVMEANIKALKAGYNFGETTEIFTTRYEVKPAKLEKGTYRNISGNEATALGMIAASKKSGLPLFLGSYPITPASDILHELSRHKVHGVKTFQAEDEIAGICSAIGASYGGAIGLTTTSGPGLALKTEAIGLAVMLELPLVIVDVQRGGPSTGLPTKTEQSDLLQAMFGRNGEAPVCVIAATTPADCFTMAYEAARLALTHMTPVILLTDGYLGNGAEPWRVPHASELPDIKVTFETNPEGFMPYNRDDNLVRPWAIPGTPGLEHRIGGLEKENITGNVCYVPENHQLMCEIRAKKIKLIENDIPLAEVEGPESGDLLVIGWGSTYGAITAARENLLSQGYNFSRVHLKYLNPLPKNLGEVLKKFKHILVPEMNLGQLSRLLKMEFVIDCESLCKIQGLPFKSKEIEKRVKEILAEK
ncbi:MAG: 2-oxoacid:acceptor oxidoreductase subunit alpha [Ignavibacteria bacterium]